MWSVDCIYFREAEEVIAFEAYLRVERGIAPQLRKLVFWPDRPASKAVRRQFTLAFAGILHAASSLQDLTVGEYSSLCLARMGHAQLLSPSLRRLSVDFVLLGEPKDPDGYADLLCWSLISNHAPPLLEDLEISTALSSFWSHIPTVPFRMQALRTLTASLDSGIQDFASFLVVAHLPVLQDLNVIYQPEEDDNVDDDEALAAFHLAQFFATREQPLHRVSFRGLIPLDFILAVSKVRHLSLNFEGDEDDDHPFEKARFAVRRHVESLVILLHSHVLYGPCASLVGVPFSSHHL
jgi:hypothetical protein